MKRTLTTDLVMILLNVGILLLVSIPYLDLVIALIITLVYCHLIGGIKQELGFQKPDNLPKSILLSVGLGLGIVLCSYFVFLPIIESITGVKIGLGVFEQLKGNVSLLITSLLLAWVVGGFIEEIIFRSFFISRISFIVPKQVGIVLAVILPSILFGYLHSYQGPSGQVLTGVVGLSLAIIFLVNKKNIWLNILTHGFTNTFSMLFLYFGIIG